MDSVYIRVILFDLNYMGLTLILDSSKAIDPSLTAYTRVPRHPDTLLLSILVSPRYTVCIRSAESAIIPSTFKGLAEYLHVPKHL